MNRHQKAIQEKLKELFEDAHFGNNRLSDLQYGGGMEDFHREAVLKKVARIREKLFINGK